MRELKIVCDKCGKEIIGEDFFVLKIDHIIEGRGSFSMDICEDCRKVIKKFLKGDK